jgi:hypothetical protein
MIQALLAGRKSMTRRIIKPQPVLEEPVVSVPRIFNYKGERFYEKNYTDRLLLMGKYQIGDVLWVRETYVKACISEDGEGPMEGSDWRYWYRVDDDWKNEEWHHPHKDGPQPSPRWKPSIFMPREAARIFLKVTDIKVERACDISEEDAIKEGIESIEQKGKLRVWKNYLSPKTPFYGNNSILSFRSLFESINGPDSWEKWVWVYSFNQIDKPC